MAAAPPGRGPIGPFRDLAHSLGAFGASLAAVLLYGQPPPDRPAPRAEERTALPLGPARAEQARDFVEGTLRSWGHDRMVEPAILCTSELVTELRECDPDGLELRLRDDVEAVHIEIRTVGCEMRFHNLVTADNTQRAAAVSVIDHVASLWGVAPVGAGEAVWFELRV